MPELIACPQCGRQLNVPDTLMGQAVQCPACKLVFTAALTVAPAQIPVAPPAASDPFVFSDSRRSSLVVQGSSPLDFSDVPLKPHRGGLILALGLIACFASISFLPGLILGYLAWSFGSTDLSRMQRGLMDPEGQSLTQVGYFLGLTAIVLTCIFPCVGCICILGGRH